MHGHGRASVTAFQRGGGNGIGHGRALVDSHHELPVVTASDEALQIDLEDSVGPAQKDEARTRVAAIADRFAAAAVHPALAAALPVSADIAALARAGVPAVAAGRQSLFETAEAGELRTLLLASCVALTLPVAARAQTGAEYVTQLLALGVRRFRVEFVDEDAATVSRTLEKYQALLKGDIDGTALWNDLKVLNQLGVTRGTMRVKL